MTGRPTAADEATTYQRSLDPELRRARGIHYTPAGVALGLARALLEDVDGPIRVGDPACGAGAFLVAAAQVLFDRGQPVERIVTRCLFGADTDASAVALARRAVGDWALRAGGVDIAPPDDHLVVADGLEATVGWLGCAGSVDAVLGNPPFGSQLRGGAVRDPAAQSRLAERLGIGALGYVDTAALFLVRALELVPVGGRVALVLPASVAAARGARSVRDAVDRRASFTGVWTGGDDVGFDAAVSVWAPLLKSGGRSERAPVARYRGRGVERFDEVARSGASSWAPYLATGPVAGPHGAAGGPRPPLGTVATVTAGFRQHFYGLAPFVVDAAAARVDGPRLVTTGVIDPLHRRTDRPVRFAGRTFEDPVVDVKALQAGAPWLESWLRSLLVPKLLVASQGTVVEVVVDPDGSMVPSTPVVAVVPDEPSDLWHLAALLCAPGTALRLHTVAGGTGLAHGSCRVSASFIADVPLPGRSVDWDRAASQARAATDASVSGDASGWADALDHVAVAMTGATGLDDATRGEIVDWWREHRPVWRGARLLER